MVHSEIIDINLLDDKSLVKKITANPDRFYLLPASSSINLCDVIDKLSKNSTSKDALTRVRIAYNIKFHLPTQLRRGNGEAGELVQSLAELLDKFEYDNDLIPKNSEDYHIIIDDGCADGDDAAVAVAKLFQQMVFLNLNLDIKMKSEITKALIKNRFRANYTKLYDEIKKQEEYLAYELSHASLTDHGKIRVTNIKTAFEGMAEGMAKARQRPIRIAAMGTKKAGKSVIINSLLKCDYAPTDSELPTPNVIRYVPANKDAGLTLDYKGQEGIPFASAEELSDYIRNEFENAQKHTGAGAGLDDMVIHYPSDDLSGYEVWDTPGPNFAGAGAEHHKIANECIKQADICIFVMNYSNHLTDDEVKFLQKIHQTFQSENKFYSLFITVNRIDERYISKVEKSVNRILDYIRLRLEDLDYKNIIIFGTSALLSFYLAKVLPLLRSDNILSSDNILIDNGMSWAEAIDTATENHPDFSTECMFLYTAIKNLKVFHGINSPSVNTLENFSGIPQLWHHVRYIGEQKVDTEIVDHVVSRCEMEFDKINNALLVTELTNLSNEDSARLRDLQSKLVDFKQTVDEALEDIAAHTDGRQSNELKAIKYDITEQINDNKREALKTAIDRGNEIVKRAQLTDDDVEDMHNGRITDNIQRLMAQIAQVLQGANEGAEAKFLQLIEIEGKNLSQQVEKTINDAQRKIITKTKEVKQSVSSDSIAGNMMRDLAIPEFPVSLNKLASSAQELNIDITSKLTDIASDSIREDKETRTRWETRQREASGFFETIFSWFGREYYEDVKINYTVDVRTIDVEKFRNEMQHILNNGIKEKLEESYTIMKEEVIDNIHGIYEDLSEQCQEISDTYEEIFDTFSDDIGNALDETSAHKKAIDHDIEVLIGIKKNVQPFFNVWHDILRGKGVG